MEGSRDSRIEALGFFIVSIGDILKARVWQVHLNKSRVEQRHFREALEEVSEGGSVRKDVPER